MKYVIIEQKEKGDVCITHVNAKNLMEAYSMYEDEDKGDIIILTYQAYCNMCMQGVGSMKKGYMFKK